MYLRLAPSSFCHVGLVACGQLLAARESFDAVGNQKQRVRTSVTVGRTPFNPFASFQVMQKPRKPRTLDVRGLRPIAACELPGLASIRSSTEYCAGRSFIDASVAYEILENDDLQSSHEIAEMLVEVSKAEPFSPSRPSIGSGLILSAALARLPAASLLAAARSSIVSPLRCMKRQLDADCCQ